MDAVGYRRLILAGAQDPELFFDAFEQKGAGELPAFGAAATAVKDLVAGGPKKRLERKRELDLFGLYFGLHGATSIRRVFQCGFPGSQTMIQKSRSFWA